MSSLQLEGKSALFLFLKEGGNVQDLISGTMFGSRLSLHDVQRHVDGIMAHVSNDTEAQAYVDTLVSKYPRDQIRTLASQEVDAYFVSLSLRKRTYAEMSGLPRWADMTDDDTGSEGSASCELSPDSDRIRKWQEDLSGLMGQLSLVQVGSKVVLPSDFLTFLGKGGEVLADLAATTGHKFEFSKENLQDRTFILGESLRQLACPQIAQSNPRKDQLRAAALSYTSALAALTSLPVYARHKNSAGAEFIAATFFCRWQEKIYDSSARQSWTLCRVPTSVKEKFVSDLNELFPAGRVSQYFVSALIELVHALFDFYIKKENLRTRMFDVLQTYMISGVSLIERCYPIVVRKRLTSDAKIRASRRKNYKPKNTDYEEYKAVHKPLIDLKICKLKDEEHSMLAQVNKQLNTAGNRLVRFPVLSAPQLCAKAAEFIGSISRDVAKVNRILDSRKSRVHALILHRRWERKFGTTDPTPDQRTQDRAEPIRKDEWSDAFDALDNEDIIRGLVSAFGTAKDLTSYLDSKVASVFL